MKLSELIALLEAAQLKIDSDPDVGVKTTCYYGDDINGVADVEFEYRVVKTITITGTHGACTQESVEDKSIVTLVVG